MNEETSKLIQQLADKLGTTAEHLWSVLCRQAPISATVDAAICIFLFVATWKSFWFVFGKTKREKIKIGGGFERLASEWEGDAAFIAWIVWICIASLFTAMISFSACDIVAGFLNPEFWALRQIFQ